MQALLNFFTLFFIFLSDFFVRLFFMVQLFLASYCLLLSFFISESAAREKITTLKCKVFSQDLPQFEN